MDKTRIIQQGEEVKFQVQIKDFDMEANDFRVELVYGYRRTTVTIEKVQMLENSGLFYIIFDTDDIVGRVTARCTWFIPDTDAPDSYREKVDEQFLCFVVTTPCPQFITCPKCSSVGHDVRYELTDEPDIAAKYLRLCVTETVIPEHGDPYPIYRPLVTRNDEYLYVLRESADALQEALNNANSNN